MWPAWRSSPSPAGCVCHPWEACHAACRPLHAAPAPARRVSGLPGHAPRRRSRLLPPHLPAQLQVAAQDPRLTNPVADTVYVTYNIQASQGVAAASAASAESQYVAARVVPLATGDGAAGNLPLRPGETPEAAAARYRKVPGVWLQPRGSPCAAGPAAGPPPAVQPASRTRQAYTGLPGAGECSYSALILWCLPMHAAASLCATQPRRRAVCRARAVGICPGRKRR